MTTLKERAPERPGRQPGAKDARKAQKGQKAPSAPARPRMQVNLLPPEVTAARTLRRVKVWLLVAVGVVVAGLVLLLLLALQTERIAQDRLAQAQERTVALQREAARYAEVPQVLGQIEDVEQARDVGMSTEVRWRTQVDALTAVLPSTMSLENYSLVAPAPQDALPSPADALQRPAVASIAFDARSLTVPDTAALMDALEAVPGFQDVRVTTVGRTAGENGTVYYQVAGSVQLTDRTFAHRFTETEEQ